MSTVAEVIQEVVVRILEDWALMTVDPLSTESAAFDEDAPFYVATVNFRGVVDGTYSIICQQGFADVLASNLLGKDPESVDEGEKEDALKEMANVLSGNLITESYGPDNSFDLVLPTVHVVDARHISGMMSGRMFCYLADDEPIGITFALENV